LRDTLDRPPSDRVEERHAVTIGAVAMLRWPEEEARRHHLAATGEPRLLLVGHGEQAPQLTDPLEDWMRDPPDPADLVARLDALAYRADQTRRVPHLDADGLLWFGRRWVVIPDTQLCIAELLLAHPNELVGTATLAATYVRHGSSGHPASIRTMLNRLVGRFEQVGLQVHLVRGKGALLEVPR
jgi:hypothetical protein